MLRLLPVIALLVLAAGQLSHPASAGIPVVRYVRAGATGANDGTSWANAYKSLRTALSHADGVHEIWVAAGTYRPTSVIVGGRGASFEIPPGLTVRGGFAGTETSLSERVLGQEPSSVLSGEIGLVGKDDNSYHVLKVPAGSDFTLEGFVITGGNADGGGDNSGGGGIIVLGDAPGAHLSRLVVKYNNAFNEGGGISARGSVNLTDVRIRGNHSDGIAGGVAVVFGDVEMSRVTIDENGASVSGAFVVSNDASLVAENLTVFKNVGFDSGQTGAVSGSAEVTVRGATFAGNFGNNDAMPSVKVSGTASFEARNSIFYDNDGAEFGIDATADATLGRDLVQGGCPASATCSGVYDFDPQLSTPVADHGGFVPALAMDPDSEAIDKGSPNGCPDDDARGAARPFDGNGNGVAACDLGAYEYITRPVIEFSSEAGERREGQGALLVPVVLSHEYPEPVSATMIVGGTAEKDVDFVLGGTATVQPNQQGVFLGILPVDDALDEPLESVILTLVLPVNGTLGEANRFEVALEDNDEPPALSFSTSASSGPESAPASIAVELSAPSAFAISASVDLGGTATSPGDYTAPPLTFVIPAGATKRSLPLAVTNDYLDEPDETVVLAFSNLENATPGAPGTHTYTIEDNDPLRRCLGRKLTIAGTPGDDVIVGTAGVDVVDGLAGNDRIRGLGGNDRICGGPGQDVLRGGAGADSLLGGAAADRLLGQGGNDTLKGAAGNDTLRGEAGRDRLSGGAGKKDVCDGGAATDTLPAGHGCETVAGVP